MRQRRSIWILLCLLCVGGAWFLWHSSHRSAAQKKTGAPIATAAGTHSVSAAPKVPGSGVINTNPAQISVMDWNTNKFAGRLSNTTKTIGQLMNDSHAILLENALIDTRLPLNFVFPKNLQPQGDPGAYIVQATGPINNAFRAMLTDMGATIVAYIPNDAYLVRASANVANALAPEPSVQAVIPYEPYYKMDPALLYLAVSQMQLPDNAALNLGLFADDASATVQQIESLGGQVIGNDQSPFGPVVRVIPPKDWTALATLPGVQIVEPYRARAAANDLARATLGVAADSLTATNYLGLTGSNIIVEVNDTGIDAQHPDLTSGTAASGVYFKNSGIPGVIGDAPQSLVDTNGHGTHVAGIIAGDGAKSTTVTNAPGSTLIGGTGTNYQFRGMAPGATLYSVAGFEGGADTNVITDQYLQEAPALTNALISNNSWVYEGDNSYDLAAASYDAATRDALPMVTGSQPVLFVFAAGNEGNGDDTSDPGGGTADSIESPATAKDVITVGAIQENRNITANVTNADGSPNTTWADETSTSYRVAGFSSRGNVGIGIEGTYGRFKPDVVAPGTFIISDRSEQWDIGTYFYQNPTNDQSQYFSGYVVQPGSIVSRPFPFIPTNVVELLITTFPNANSPFSYAVLPTWIGLFSTPGYQYLSMNNPVTIPPGPPTLQEILSTEGAVGAFNYAISNNTGNQVIFDLETDIITTNGSGNYYLALSNLDQSIGTLNSASTGPGPYYRFETGTSMSAADVSGVLALMQEFYANAYGYPPSPAMLKAMLINGAQVTSSYYDYDPQDSINFEGWGLVNLPDSLPLGMTNQIGVACSAYLQDQNPTNALATGASQTYQVTLTNNAAPLRVTLAWTDPPGDPAAAIKLVNSLQLVVTNYSNPTNIFVYYGNDISTGNTNNTPRAANMPPVFDSINNVQTVSLPPGAGTNFSVTVLGYRVNVNAVTAQTNNVVQDYALVISTGNSGLTNVMTVNPVPAASGYNATGDQQVTYPSQSSAGSGNTATSFAELLNQFAGANSPLLGTNTIVFTPAAPEGFGPTNWQVTVGQTNQWQFYVVTNTYGYSNAAFITFNPNSPDPDTLSIPRMGVFAGTVGNATREADIDLYVTTDPSITNLNPVAISNAVVGTQIGAPPGANFAGASLGPGTSEFVVDTNSQSRGSPPVYYIGVKSEDQMSAEYGFITIFSAAPFSTQNQNGQTVYGVPVPFNIPDGSPTIPGKAYIFGLAIYPMAVGTVTVSNEITHQNFGDLIGTLTLNGGHADVLNNHDSLGNPPGPYYLTYDDSAGGGIPGSRKSDGPGSLIGYIGQQAIGVWQLTEVDDSLTQTGAVNSFTVNIQRYQNPTLGVITNYVPGGSWVYGYIDVPPGATNLTVYATNLTDTANPPVELFVKYGSEPTTNDFDQMVVLNPPSGTGVIPIGPPLESGTYYYGLFNPNPNSTTQEILLFATIGLGAVPGQAIFSSTDTPIPIPDDAVMDDSIYVPANQTISSLDVGIAVQHPRISDLVFTLIGPDGTRDLLMENRGGTDTNGAGGIGTIVTNTVMSNSFDTVAATNYTLDRTVAGWTVSGNQVSVVTDPNNAYTGNSNLLALANGGLYTTLNTTPGASYTLTFVYRGPGIVGWWRGESNVNDSVYGNNGVAVNAGYTNGVVGTAFENDPESYPYGTYNGFDVPDQPIYQLTNSLSIEGWIRPRGDSYVIFWRGDNRSGFDPYFLGMQDNNILGFFVENAAGTSASVFTTLAYNQWYHVAGTLDGNSGNMDLYTNGVLAAQINTTIRPFGPLIQNDSPGIGIGNVNDGRNNFPFIGDIDEISLYSRALSASEVGAIYNDGGAGKFDPIEFTSSPPQSLAEAQVTINNAGVSASTNFFGSNTNWQTETVTFTAAGSSTTLKIQGIEPGMLLDAASVVSVTTNYSYLTFTENTNLTTTPIKFAVPPFNTNSIVWQNGFEESTAGGTIYAPTYFSGGWQLVSGSVDVYGPSALAYSGNYFIDLDGSSAGEISTNITTIPGQVYTLNFAYARNPDSINGIYGHPPNVPQAAVLIDSNQVGVVTANYTNSWSSLGWRIASYVFTATSTTTHLAIESLDVPNNISGVFLDAFTLTASPYYLPEQPLDVYDGLNAQGLWTLEIQDDRVGATNPPPLLLSWQLRFTFVTAGTNVAGIPTGTTLTNVIPANSFAYYRVNVPTNADMATNLLVFATGPLFVWFNPTNNPIGSAPPDDLLFGNATAGSSTLSTFSVPTNIVPGGVYYIGLQNTNSYQVTNGFEVDFHYFQTSPLTNGVPVTNTISGTIAGDGMAYYSVTVPTNAVYATNLLLFASQPVNVWFDQTKPPVGLAPPDYLLIPNATNGVSILSAGSTPPLLPGLTYYLAVQNTNAAAATFGLQVNFDLVSVLTNGVPGTNTVPANSFAYYEVQVPTNADYATNLLLFASLPVNVWFNQITLPTGTNPPDYLLIGNATNGVSVLSTGSTPPLVPGATYYLGVQNTNGVPVNFGLEVNFHLVIPSVISGLTITATNVDGTNGFLLQWSGPTNYQYIIQWTTNLAPPTPWNTVLNPIINVTYTPTNGNYSWFDDGSLTGGWPPEKFYRVIANLLSGPITTNSGPVTNVIVPGSITPLTVTVPANAIAASNLLVSATGPVNVWFNQTATPTGNTNLGDVLMLSNVSSGSFLLTGSSVPPLVPGANYYLGLQNPGSNDVSFVFQVNFAYAAPTTNAPTISGITFTNIGGTNAILLKWVAPTNYQFQVQWATNLPPIVPWNTISNVVVTWSGVVSPTNAAYGFFQFLDDGSLTGGFAPVKFYRLIAYPPGATIPQTLVIINYGMVGGSVRFQWVAPTNYQYQILWTTNLGLPLGSWSLLANPVLGLTNGVYTFTDTNQTGPPISPKFFRMVELP